MEFLYLSEGNLRVALGPALFRNRDLRSMAGELGIDVQMHRGHEQLIAAILRALCFNPVVPPLGITSYLARLEELCAEVRRDPEPPVQTVMRATIEAGQVLERVLKDLLRLYGSFFWGATFVPEMVQRNIVPPRRDADPLNRLTIGQAKEAFFALSRLVKQESKLREKLRQLGRENDALLPLRFHGNSTADETDVEQVFGDLIRLRNAMAHDRDEQRDGQQVVNPNQFLEVVEQLAAFLVACQRGSYYPEVMRYEGTYENRDGERFVYFVDERGKTRTVRTDERIDARRHYYCFATNNPVYLFPTLIPRT